MHEQADPTESPDEYVDPAELAADLQAVRRILNRLSLHTHDSDDVEAVARLLKDLAGVRKLVAECYRDVETTLLNLAGERVVMTVDGPFEILRKTKRTEWRHEDLQKEVREVAQRESLDPMALYIECARPSWRVAALRSHGIDPADFCFEKQDGYSVRLPGADLEETF